MERHAAPPPFHSRNLFGKITRRLAIDRWRYRNACKRGAAER